MATENPPVLVCSQPIPNMTSLAIEDDSEIAVSNIARAAPKNRVARR